MTDHKGFYQKARLLFKDLESFTDRWLYLFFVQTEALRMIPHVAVVATKIYNKRHVSK